MPRGENPNSKANLIKSSDLTSKELRERAKKGGEASAKKRAEYKTFKECFKANMTDDMRKELFNMLYNRAKRGNLKAFEILRDTLGEKPISEIAVENMTPSQEVVDAIEDFMMGDDE